jgi:hypothetical protein
MKKLALLVLVMALSAGAAIIGSGWKYFRYDTVKIASNVQYVIIDTTILNKSQSLGQDVYFTDTNNVILPHTMRYPGGTSSITFTADVGIAGSLSSWVALTVGQQ